MESGPTNAGIHTGETQIKVFWDENKARVAFDLRTRSKFADKTVWNMEVATFLHELQEKVFPHINSDYMPIHTCHRRNGQIFRGHPNFRGKGPWKDRDVAARGRV